MILRRKRPKSQTSTNPLMIRLEILFRIPILRRRSLVHGSGSERCGEDKEVRWNPKQTFPGEDMQLIDEGYDVSHGYFILH